MPTPIPWEMRPVPGMSIIAIAQQGKMYPHAYVQTPTAFSRPLTELEYQRAQLIVDACNHHAALVAALRRYVNCDPAQHTPGDTPAAQAVRALARAEKYDGTLDAPADTWEVRPHADMRVIDIAEKASTYPHAFVHSPAACAETLTDLEFDNAKFINLACSAHAGLVAALTRYVNCDRARDIAGDTPAAQAVLLLRKLNACPDVNAPSLPEPTRRCNSPC